MIKGMRRLLSYTRRAVDDYGMISEGDRIAVGVSGGKDSLSLLYTLAELRRFYDYSEIEALCRSINVEYYVEPSNIAKIVFDIRKESNPCSLCAKLRRGMVNDTAKKLGYGKVALGHHFDDVVETFMLNLFYEGRLGCFSPVTYLDRTDVTVIRPFLYAPEKDIRYFASHASLPVLSSGCPANGNTERESMKKLLSQLERDNKGLRHRIFGAMQKARLDGYMPTRLKRYDGALSEENDGILNKK